MLKTWRRHRSGERSLRRLVLWALVLITLLLAGSEAFARYGLGLGDPPLSVTDPDMEYRFAPSQHRRRFGNTVTYNQYSMRATPDLSPDKSDPNELRVMLLGDSVVNGGALTDDNELASVLLQRELKRTLSRPVLVGNISAGGWGPCNLLGYVNHFGLFHADIVVIVLSSHDAWDVMRFDPRVGLSASYPDHTPRFALAEVVSRYLMPRLERGLSHALTASNGEPLEGNGLPTGDLKATETSLKALTELVGKSRTIGARVVVVLHPTQTELRDGPDPIRVTLTQVAKDAGAEVLDMYPAIKSRSSYASLYREDDDIHPSAAGQLELYLAIDRHLALK